MYLSVTGADAAAGTAGAGAVAAADVGAGIAAAAVVVTAAAAVIAAAAIAADAGSGAAAIAADAGDRLVLAAGIAAGVADKIREDDAVDVGRTGIAGHNISSKKISRRLCLHDILCAGPQIGYCHNSNRTASY